MNKTKAIVDFSGYAGPDLGPVAHTIHDQLTANAATFPAPPVTLAALLAAITDFQQKLAAKASRATADVLACNAARHGLESLLAELGGYVNAVAKGDPALVIQSGFPSYIAGHSPAPAALGAPQDLRLSHGVLSGSIKARCRPSGQRSMNEVQTCTGDPNVEDNWSHAGMFSGGKAVISGLPVGVTVWVRVRTAGTGGAMGPWSDPAKIVVT